MTIEDAALSDVQFLSHEVPKRLAITVFMEILPTLLGLPQDGPSNELLASLKEFNKVAKLRGANGRGLSPASLPLFDAQEDTPALPSPTKRLGRPRKEDVKGPTKAQIDPRSMDEWRTELVTWALAHDGTIDTDVYRAEKFVKDYPTTSFTSTRGSQTLTYATTQQKLFVRKDGKYHLTAKGRKYAAEQGLTAAPDDTPHTPDQPAKIEFHLPSGARPGGQIERAFKFAMQHANRLNLRDFSLQERRDLGSSPGVPKLTMILLRSGHFVKDGEGFLRLQERKDKTMAARA